LWPGALGARAAAREPAALLGSASLVSGERILGLEGALVGFVDLEPRLAASLDAQAAAAAVHRPRAGQQPAPRMDREYQCESEVVAAPRARTHGRPRGAESVRQSRRTRRHAGRLSEPAYQHPLR